MTYWHAICRAGEGTFKRNHVIDRLVFVWHNSKQVSVMKEAGRNSARTSFHFPYMLSTAEYTEQREPRWLWSICFVASAFCIFMKCSYKFRQWHITLHCITFRPTLAGVHQTADSNRLMCSVLRRPPTLWRCDNILAKRTCPETITLVFVPFLFFSFLCSLLLLMHTCDAFEIFERIAEFDDILSHHIRTSLACH